MGVGKLGAASMEEGRAWGRKKEEDGTVPRAGYKYPPQEFFGDKSGRTDAHAGNSDENIGEPTW